MKELFIIICFIGLSCIEEYRIDRIKTENRHLKWVLSVPPEDSIIVECVRCGQINVRNIFTFPDTIDNIIKDHNTISR